MKLGTDDEKGFGGLGLGFQGFVQGLGFFFRVLGLLESSCIPSARGAILQHFRGCLGAGTQKAPQPPHCTGHRHDKEAIAPVQVSVSSEKPTWSWFWLNLGQGSGEPECSLLPAFQQPKPSISGCGQGRFGHGGGGGGTRPEFRERTRRAPATPGTLRSRPGKPWS